MFLPGCFGYTAGFFQVVGHYVVEPLLRAGGFAGPRLVKRRTRGGSLEAAVRIGLAPAGATYFDVPPPGTRVICDHPAGPWGNPGHYDGGYVGGMELYWRARGGTCHRA